MTTTLRPLLAIAALLFALPSGCTSGSLVAHGERRELRAAPEKVRKADVAARPKILVLALDGVDRSLLYGMLRKGELPELATVLGGREGDRFPHAHFDDTLLSTMPSCTLPAWAAIFSGKPPAETGITGNEFFIRESLTFAAPAPVSFDDSAPNIQMYTADYANRLLAVPTVYERLREREKDISIWVSMSQFYTGADLLLMPLRGVIGDAFMAFLQDKIKSDDRSRKLFAAVDYSAEMAVENELDQSLPPDVLTLYLPGSDCIAHVATDGPTPARREYLRDVVDPMLGRLWRKLAEKKSTENRYVIVVSDHGHTQVQFDFEHALSPRWDDSPSSVLREAGFRVRPFSLTTGVEDFQAVLAYGGATAFVYVADRSSLMPNWTRPPRFQEDVLPAADAFFQANETGKNAPSMKGTLDMVLTRVPRLFAEVAEPFQVYIGNGRLQPVSAYLREHPHLTYVAVEDRLRELAAGRFGERAGDVMLIAHNGDRDLPSKRFYFAERYRSWHGSPSRQDSEVPFIVAHARRSAEDIGRVVKETIGLEPRVQKVTDVILRLRADR